MQFELRTQVIEPERKTFQHLIDRYGDRPASRYEEGTIDLQAVANYHFRPLWEPDMEIYSPDYSVLKLTDPYDWADPRQLYYAPYVTSRADLHEAFANTLAYLEKRGMWDRLPEEWRAVVGEVVLPMRHYEAAAQMVSSNAARFGWGTTVTQCAAYSAFDRVGNAQMLSRAGIAFGGGTAQSLADAKQLWLDDVALQPMRRLVEENLVRRDWGIAMVTLDVTDILLYSLLYDHLDNAALTGGAGSYSLVAQHLSTWFADQRRWLDSLYKAWVSDPTYGEPNLDALRSAVEAALTSGESALTPLADKIDRLVGAGCREALAASVINVRAHLAALGLTEKEN